mmetsp:Transcript_2445/g.5848  ORF Transcript_2445/g.5848 Transcript_2445/m.5848 type:complete len:247 (-) Transcript_2445:307-1047(-)
MCADTFGASESWRRIGARDSLGNVFIVSTTATNAVVIPFHIFQISRTQGAQPESAVDYSIDYLEKDKLLGATKQLFVPAKNVLEFRYLVFVVFFVDFEHGLKVFVFCRSLGFLLGWFLALAFCHGHFETIHNTPRAIAFGRFHFRFFRLGRRFVKHGKDFVFAFQQQTSVVHEVGIHEFFHADPLGYQFARNLEAVDLVGAAHGKIRTFSEWGLDKDLELSLFDGFLGGLAFGTTSFGDLHSVGIF